MFCIGDIVELIVAITDDDNVIFPPPTFVKIVDIHEDSWFKYGVMVVRESELPNHLQGKQFRTKMANYASKGSITVIGDQPDFFNGDSGIDDKYFNKIYWEPKIYLRIIN